MKAHALALLQFDLPRIKVAKEMHVSKQDIYDLHPCRLLSHQVEKWA